MGRAVLLHAQNKRRDPRNRCRRPGVSCIEPPREWTDEVIGIIPGSRADERAWHQLLAEYHVTGEWFRAEPEVLEHIRKVCAATAADSATA